MSTEGVAEAELAVLVVEDMSADARLIELLLREVLGASVDIHPARRMADAEAAVHTRRFDVILLDLSLPDTDRLETMKRMKAAAPETPIVVLTVHDDEPLAIDSLREGAQDYLPKTDLKPALLKRSLRYAIERQRVDGKRRIAEERSRIAADLVSGEQRERRRLAEELHDHLAQLLAAAKLRVCESRKRCEHDVESLVEVERLLEESLEYTRTLVADTAPYGLFEHGIVHALEVLARNMERHGLKTSVDAAATPNELDPRRAELLYQCVRELLFNVVRHAGVNEAQLHVAVEHDDLVVTVADQGSGFDPTAKGTNGQSTFGLSSVRNRVMTLGGTIETDSSPGKGTRTDIRVPVADSR